MFPVQGFGHIKMTQKQHIKKQWLPHIPLTIFIEELIPLSLIKQQNIHLWLDAPGLKIVTPALFSAFYKFTLLGHI